MADLYHSDLRRASTYRRHAGLPRPANRRPSAGGGMAVLVSLAVLAALVTMVCGAVILLLRS